MPTRDGLTIYNLPGPFATNNLPRGPDASSKSISSRFPNKAIRNIGNGPLQIADLGASEFIGTR
jgi:hypothetical protein